MSVQDVWQVCFDFFRGKPVNVEPVDEHLSTDAGLLVFRQFDERQQLTAGFAAQLEDLRRDPDHPILEMVRSRVFGILAGYEDQNDHDALRSDAVFKLLADRSPEGDDLASQPTLSRFENAVTARSLLNLEEWFLERFVSSFAEPPREITLDVDVFDDPTHGEQQLTFFHGFYEQYQYLVRVLTCAENDLVVLPVLLYGTADPALGLVADLERVVTRLRQTFPGVLIRLRADSGFARPRVYEACERLKIEYSIGLGMNPVVKRASDELLQDAVKTYETTGQPQRLFTGFDYQAATWPSSRWVVVKCEAHAPGTNRRAVVTNRPGARTLPQGTYEEYAERGESENRNKELKSELCADRLSDHRYLANACRMFLHCLAANLLVLLRQDIASPPANEPAHPSDYPAPQTVTQEQLPPEARTGRTRRRDFNRRREVDPLGEGHACTWRMRLIKVAARFKVTARCIRVFLSGSWPFLDHFRDVSRAVLDGS
jgi:hypothetical protein